MNAKSVRMYPDVNILLTLDFEQPRLLRKCTIFKDSIQRADITCYQLSTVKTIRNLITQEVVLAGGNALRGLWNHLSMAKGGGVPHILEKAVINEADLPGIQSFFHQKIRAQERDLAKSQIQIQEVWAIDTFREMETTYKGQVPLMDYLLRLATKLNEYYVEAKNSQMRTEHSLTLIDEEPVDPKTVDATSLEQTLNQEGFDDKEDLNHLASLLWLKQNKGYAPIFATADRKLYECKDIIYKQTQITVEDPLYAAGTYRKLQSQLPYGAKGSVV
jgi:hypothetical protein